MSIKLGIRCKMLVAPGTKCFGNGSVHKAPFGLVPTLLHDSSSGVPLLAGSGLRGLVVIMLFEVSVRLAVDVL